MRQYELIEAVQLYNPNVNEVLLNKAYIYSMRKHLKQKRISGDPYFTHPLEVAAILINMRLDETTIAVALLHDTLEDTSATREEIDKLFGSEIGGLVEGVTKLTKLDFISHKAIQAENLRKFLLAVCDDIRVLLVKFADRLHNMRTLTSMRPDKQVRIAEETMEVYAPLAGRMGMQDMREELEDLSFRYINKDAWSAITTKLDEMYQKNSDLILQIEQELEKLLKVSGIEGRVYGRQKKAWSIFRKMQRKALSFEQLSDIYGFRVIVDSPEDCYRVLGLAHMRWSMVPGRFKDYISTPKHNGYKSLHTTLVGLARQRVELQIRTESMNDIAERGIAAHSLYKDKGSDVSTNPSTQAEAHVYDGLKQIINSLSDGANPEEFLEHTKLELFQDQVFCFTPKGRLISLPRGATPIDFAYAVHTQIGHSCIGVRVNGRNMPLMTSLRNGDEVEIITAKNAVPSSAWEAFAVTGKAKSAIRKATRAAVKQQYSGLGRKLLENTFARYNKIFSREDLGLLVAKLARSDVDDILAAVGCGELSSLEVLRALYPNHKEERLLSGSKVVNVGALALSNTPMDKESAMALLEVSKEEDSGQDLPIRCVNMGLPVRFCPSGAVPGDRIVGIIEPGKEIVIYPIQALALKAYEADPERWVDVRWDLESTVERRFFACLRIVISDELGVLAKITRIISDQDTSIKNMVINAFAEDFYELFIHLAVWDLKHLSMIMSQLKLLPFVNDLRRIYDERS